MGNSSSSGIRYASPSEKRVVIREALDYYRTLYVGGIYEVDGASVDTESKSTYAAALRHCIREHPLLSVLVRDAHTEKPFYESCPIARVEDHIQILSSTGKASTALAIEQIIPSIVDAKPSVERPPWKIVVLPLKDDGPSGRHRCFVAFAYSHATLDGTSGTAFHRSFLAGLRASISRAGDAEESQEPAAGSVPPPFDTPKTLPISWSFLLSPLIGAYVPRWLGSLIGFRPAVSRVTDTTYLGNPVFLDSEKLVTGARVLVIETKALEALLKACKSHNVKLTAFLHQVISYALSRALPPSLKHVDNFVSQTTIGMREPLHVSNDQMGNYASGWYHTHPRVTSEFNNEDGSFWKTAQETSTKLHAEAFNLSDQPIGLLRYLPNFKTWYLGYLGRQRDSSYELSNLMSFDPEEGRDESRDVDTKAHNWSVGTMFFGQPSNITGPPLNFSVIGRKGGALSVTVNWQRGSLGVEDEDKFVGTVCEEMERLVREIGNRQEDVA